MYSNSKESGLLIRYMLGRNQPLEPPLVRTANEEDAIYSCFVSRYQ